MRTLNVRLLAVAEECDTVAMPSAKPIPDLMTAEQIEALYLPGKSTELIRGHLVVREPPSTHHGRIAATLCYFVTDFVRRHRLGSVFAQDTGFKIESNPDTVRAPAIAFLAEARSSQVPNRGYAQLAPDLIAEIVSPDDSPGEVLAKVGDWLEAGVTLVWVIDPRREEARVYRGDGSVAIIGKESVIDGEDVLPGFKCHLKEALG
jgi:Uma2 family endonuclease